MSIFSKLIIEDDYLYGLIACFTKRFENIQIGWIGWTIMAVYAIVPNPRSSNSILSFDAEIEGAATFRLIQVDGKTNIWTSPLMIGINTVPIDLEHLSAGIYTLIIQFRKEQQILRLVKIAN